MREVTLKEAFSVFIAVLCFPFLFTIGLAAAIALPALMMLLSFGALNLIASSVKWVIA